MKNKVVFIASCGHSGSTILELLLTSNVKCVGIGEAFQLVDLRNRVIDRVEEFNCGCGEAIVSCDLWRDIVAKIRRNDDMTPENRYEFIYRSVFEKFGKEAIIIDSSKVIHAIDIVSRLENINFKVVHLVRDVRAHCVSMKRNYIRRKEFRLLELMKKFGLKGLYKYRNRNSFYVFQDWYRTNIRIREISSRLNLQYLSLSYEDLCLDSDNALNKLHAFLGFETSIDGLCAEETKNHNIFGNRLRHDPDKRTKLKYDYKWLSHSDWILASLCLPHVMKLNNSAKGS